MTAGWKPRADAAVSTRDFAGPVSLSAWKRSGRFDTLGKSPHGLGSLTTLHPGGRDKERGRLSLLIPPRQHARLCRRCSPIGVGLPSGGSSLQDLTPAQRLEQHSGYPSRPTCAVTGTAQRARAERATPARRWVWRPIERPPRGGEFRFRTALDHAAPVLSQGRSATGNDLAIRPPEP